MTETISHGQHLEAENERLRTRLRETTEAIRTYVEVGQDTLRDDWLTEEISLNQATLSSWEVARHEPGRWAASESAHAAAEALVALMAASRKRSVTVQWMPDDDGYGCRFEVISVRSGDYIAIVQIDNEGRVTLSNA